MIVFVFFFKGFSALCSQILLLREIFIILSGNELYFGAFFAIWLFSGAIGSFTAKFIRKNFAFIFLVLTAFEGLYLFASLGLIRLHQNLFNIFPGQILSILQSVLLIFLTAGVFTFCQGIRFVIGANLFRLNITGDRGPGLFYGWEAAGALSGGFVFAFLIQKYTNPFETAAIISIVNIASCLPVFFKVKKNPSLLIFPWLAFFLLLSFLFFLPQGGLYSKINKITLMKQWHLKTPPAYWVNTHYGNITIFENNNQLSFIVDGNLLFALPYPDKEWIETTVHFPMLFSNKTDNILIIGAGIKGTISEVLKYDVRNIDCVEINPEIVNAIKKFSPSYFPGYLSKKVHIIQDDVFRILKKTTKWDVVIVDAGIPFSLKTARFYTKEFFQLIKEHLSENGILYLTVDGSPEYMSEPLSDVHKIVYSTLKTVFPSIQIIPGYSTGYCATTGKDVSKMSSLLLAQRKKERKIDTTVVTDFYLKERLDEEKKEYFLKLITVEKGVINTGRKPFIVIPALEYWIFLSSGEMKTVEKSFLFLFSMLLSAIFVVLFSALKKENRETKILDFTVLSTGFFSITLELILLFLFQLYHGSLYFYLSILTGFFMGGMAAGSIIFSKIAEKEKNWTEFLFLWQLGQMIFTSIILASISKMAFTKIFFFGSMAIIGFFAGWEFPLVNKIYLLRKGRFPDSISRFYAADLFGATTGSFLTPIFLVPVLGIVPSLIMFIFIKLMVALAVWKLNRC